MGDTEGAEDVLVSMFPNLDAALIRDVLRECDTSMGDAVDALILMSEESSPALDVASSPAAPSAPAPQAPTAISSDSGRSRPHPAYRPFPTAEGPPKLPPEWLQGPLLQTQLQQEQYKPPSKSTNRTSMSPQRMSGTMQREWWTGWPEEVGGGKEGAEQAAKDLQHRSIADASLTNAEQQHLDKGKAPMLRPDDDADGEGLIPSMPQRPRLSADGAATSSSGGGDGDDVGFLLSCFPELDLSEGTARDLLTSHGNQVEAVLGFLLNVSSQNDGWELEYTEEEREAQEEYDRMAEDERLAVQLAFAEGLGGGPDSGGVTRDMQLAELCSEFPDYDAEVLHGILEATQGDMEMAKMMLGEGDDQGQHEEGYEEAPQAEEELQPRNRFAALEAAMAAGGVPDLGDFRASDSTRRANRKLSMKLGRLQARFPTVHKDVLALMLEENNNDEKLVTAGLKAGGLEPLPDEARDRSPPPVIPQSALQTPKEQPVPVERRVAHKQAKQRRQKALANPVDNAAARHQIAAMRAELDWVQARTKEKVAIRQSENDAGYNAISARLCEKEAEARQLRLRAQSLRHMQKNLLINAMAARNHGDYQQANALRQHAERIRFEGDACNEQASRLMGIAKNAHLPQQSHKVDVHGQQRQEAERKIDALIKAMYDLGTNTTLQVITGKGNHSAGGVPVLRPALEEHLAGMHEIESFYVNPQNTGEIIVQIRQQHQ